MTSSRRRKKLKEQDEQRTAAAAREPQPSGDDPGNVGSEGPEGALGLEEAEHETVAPPSEQVIEALSTELEELEDRHLRLVAEFDNFRKRTARERAQQAERAQAELVRRLLESLDDLARVSEHGSVDHDAAALLHGVQLVEAKIQRILEQVGLKPIEAVGKPFDPEVHDAMITVPTAEPEEDEVVSQELTKGYMFKDMLLRPSLVEVKKYQPVAPPEEGDAVSEEDES